MASHATLAFFRKRNREKGKFTKTPNGFVVTGGHHNAFDLARFCITRKQRRDAAETRIGSQKAARIRAQMASKLQRIDA